MNENNATRYTRPGVAPRLFRKTLKKLDIVACYKLCLRFEAAIAALVSVGIASPASVDLLKTGER
jgi:hypothetical protein